MAEVSTVTLTIQAGNTDDRLTQKDWAKFVVNARSVIEGYAEEIHFFGGSATYLPWQNVCWVVEVVESDMQFLNDALKLLRKKWSQQSVAVTQGVTEFV